MSRDPLLVRAQGVWQELASVPVSFGAAGDVDVVVSPRSRICPRGWAGIVLLGGAAIVTAPSEEAAARIRKAVAELPADQLTDLEAVGRALPNGEFLGPAGLAYVAAEGFRPAAAPAGLRVEEGAGGYFDLGDLEQVAGTADADEAGLDEMSSPAFVVRVDGQVVAAAGYYEWPGRAAHVGVLTAPAWRGKGLARATGSAAVRHALAQGLLPQWRARVPASRKVAVALGFSELGSQMSFELV
ncbi:GNAT family N-acetyltransferase [Kitasatospora sp. NPDC057542]|uniref:GNAT family N-acetyltransferase n=1 Tax=Streptomycetaceae TaxID=2062 RepID=UPI001CCA8B84|nr:GNAT family N-acetyltransferase [Streptomyces sp. LS1784]